MPFSLKAILSRPIVLLMLWSIPYIGLSQIPTYYSSIDFNGSAEDLKTDLSYLITVTQTTALPYTAYETDTWDAVSMTDEDPNNSANVLLFYGYDDYDGNSETDRTRDKSYQCHTTACTGLWNREHVFAKSLANPPLITDEPGSGTDVHNLRAIDGDMNETRFNNPYEDDGLGGNAHMTINGFWYPGEEWKGDVARIIMYMYLRYPTQCEANNIGVGLHTYSPDMPDVFLQWNAEDPVSAYETQRNTVLEALQGNRNPFIDNPYLATKIWGGQAAQDTWGVLSTDDLSLNPIKLYPVPVHDRLYISNATSARYDIAVYNLNGQQLNVALHNNAMNVETLTNGIYLVQISEENRSTVLKFIKY